MKEPGWDLTTSEPSFERLGSRRRPPLPPALLPRHPGWLVDCGYLSSSPQPVPPPLLLPPHHHQVACSYQNAPQFLMWSVPHALRLFFTLPLALINLVLFSLAFVQRQASLGSGESRPGIIYHLNSGNGG